MFTSPPYPKAQLVKTFEDEANTLLLDEMKKWVFQ